MTACRKYWRRRPLLYCLSLFVGCAAVGYAARIEVLSLGDSGPVFHPLEGEIFSLHYTHSMYGVPVVEKLRFENGHLTLFQVASSEAALEYFGIEKKGENNARTTLVEFSIPRASSGNHELWIRDRKISLRGLAGRDEPVRIRLAQMPFTNYLVERLWR